MNCTVQIMIFPKRGSRPWKALTSRVCTHFQNGMCLASSLTFPMFLKNCAHSPGFASLPIAFFYFTLFRVPSDARRRENVRVYQAPRLLSTKSTKHQVNQASSLPSTKSTKAPWRRGPPWCAVWPRGRRPPPAQRSQSDPPPCSGSATWKHSDLYLKERKKKTCKSY